MNNEIKNFAFGSGVRREIKIITIRDIIIYIIYYTYSIYIIYIIIYYFTPPLPPPPAEGIFLIFIVHCHSRIQIDGF